MNATISPVTSQADPEILLTRVISAPRELVFKAWTDSKHIVQWWGPKGFTTTTREMNVRPGGVWRFVMHGPDGRDYQNRITFIEITPPERIVYNHGSEGEVEPVRFQTTVTFEERGGKTKLTMQALFESAAEMNRVEREYGAIEGGRQTLERLEQFVITNLVQPRNKLIVTMPSDCEIRMERLIDAPRELVWNACTDPRHIPHWWGRRQDQTTVDRMDVQPGGAWRFVVRDGEGREYGFRGEYKEVSPPNKLSYTFEFEPMAGHVLLETIALENFAGKTKLVITQRYDSPADRDGMYQSGMEAGANESMDRLEELLTDLQNRN